MHYWSRALGPVSRKRKIETIRAQVVLCNQICEAIAEELETVPLTEEQRSVLTQRSEVMLRESHVLQLAVDLLERQEREEHSFRPE